MVADLATRTPDQDRRAAGAPWPLRHFPDGRGRHPAAGVRQHPCADQRPARTAFHSSVRMTAYRARSARPNAGDGTGAFGQGRDHASDGPISLHGRATPPARGILRKPRTKMLGEPRSVALTSRKERQMGNVGEYVGAPMTQEQSAKMALAGASNFIDIISDLKCALLINKSKLPLITSDNPAVESNRFILQKYKGLKNWGLSTAGIYLYLPISPKYAFIAYDKCVYKLSGKVGRICDINQADVFILNQLIFLNSDNSIYFHNNEFPDKLVAGLKVVSGLRQDSEFRVNVAVLTENNESKEYQTFVAVTDEEFMNAGEGLLHIESRPPKINKHFSKLRYQYKLRYVDTRSGAGLRRYTVDQDALRRNRY